MSDDKLVPVRQRPPSSPDTPQLARRLFIFRATAILSVAAAFSLRGAPHARAQQGDSDPTDPSPNSDFDPTDAKGRGRGKGGKKGAGRGVTDDDPTDGKGRGKGGGGLVRGPDQAGSVTDTDPTDGKGRGKGGPRRQGYTDKDPDDAKGRGKGRRPG